MILALIRQNKEQRGKLRSDGNPRKVNERPDCT